MIMSKPKLIYHLGNFLILPEFANWYLFINHHIKYHYCYNIYDGQNYKFIIFIFLKVFLFMFLKLVYIGIIIINIFILIIFYQNNNLIIIKNNYYYNNIY